MMHKWTSALAVQGYYILQCFLFIVLVVQRHTCHLIWHWKLYAHWDLPRCFLALLQHLNSSWMDVKCNISWYLWYLKVKGIRSLEKTGFLEWYKWYWERLYLSNVQVKTFEIMWRTQQKYFSNICQQLMESYMLFDSLAEFHLFHHEMWAEIWTRATRGSKRLYGGTVVLTSAC